MDLSKLYYEKELEAQEKIDADRNLQVWIEDCKKIAGYDSNYEFKNITIKSTPAYLFKFVFQKLERTFEREERGYNGEQDFPINPKGLHDLTFDSYSIEDIAVSDDIYYPEGENTISRLLGTQELHICPTCRGKGLHTCRECDGKGWIPCSRCRYSGRIGYVKQIIKRDKGCGPEVGKEFYGPEGGTWRYVKCPKCTYSRYGQGKEECSCNNGVVKCNRCKATGKIVTFISNKDHYFPLESSSINYWHETIPDELKKILKDTNINLYAESKPLNDTEESLDSVSLALSKKGLNAVQEKYDGLYNSVCSDNDIDDYTEDDQKFITSRITKVNVRIFKINILYITYDCNGKNYELWFYGKDNFVFTQDNPFMDVAKLYEKQANALIEKKKYAKAVKPLEKACKVADITCNHASFSNYANQLKIARKKSNLFYIVGTSLGAAFLVTLFLLFPNLFMHIKGGVLKSFFDIQEKKYIELAAIIENFFITIIIPSFFSFVLFIKIIRNKITSKILRLMCSFLLPIAYSISFGYLDTKFNSLTETVYGVCCLALLFLGLIFLFAIKAPYHNFKMATILSSNQDDNDNEDNTKEETDEESDEESDVYNEISPKGRLLAAVLAFLLGYVGVHNFYVGKKLHGFLQLATIFVGLFFVSGAMDQTGSTKTAIGGLIIGGVLIWGFVEFIMICTGRYKDANGAIIKNWAEEE